MYHALPYIQDIIEDGYYRPVAPFAKSEEMDKFAILTSKYDMEGKLCGLELEDFIESEGEKLVTNRVYVGKKETVYEREYDHYKDLVCLTIYENGVEISKKDLREINELLSNRTYESREKYVSCVRYPQDLPLIEKIDFSDQSSKKVIIYECANSKKDTVTRIVEKYGMKGNLIYQSRCVFKKSKPCEIEEDESYTYIYSYPDDKCPKMSLCVNTNNVYSIKQEVIESYDYKGNWLHKNIYWVNSPGSPMLIASEYRSIAYQKETAIKLVEEYEKLKNDFYKN